MEHKYLSLWMEIWLIASAIICALDSIFTTFRPRTLPGGDMKWFGLWEACMHTADTRRQASIMLNIMAMFQGMCMWTSIIDTGTPPMKSLTALGGSCGSRLFSV